MKQWLTRLLPVVALLILPIEGRGADLARLTQLFKENYRTLYQPRFCQKNVMRLLEAARDQNIDLENSYVLRIDGAGFWETSGFYSRSRPQERIMLGYFHYVLVAENHVFDFDLYEGLVLPLEDYIRLQFTPPTEPYLLFGNPYRTLAQLQAWDLTRIEADAALKSDTPEITWKKRMGEVLDLQEILARPRLR